MWDAPLDIHVRCGIPNILFGRFEPTTSGSGGHCSTRFTQIKPKVIDGVQHTDQGDVLSFFGIGYDTSLPHV